MTSSLHRTEYDTFGDIQVPADRLWGAQTQRALEHFSISHEVIPREIIEALTLIKQAAAAVNADLGVIERRDANAIIAAADEVLAGGHAAEFPLSVWQSGSGTQTNMNVNEVLANRASEILGGSRGTDRSVHPNDDVNRGQSTNDVFPSAIHIAVAMQLRDRLLPALNQLRATLATLSTRFDPIVKIGRTHLQDATPLTLGQEFSGYVAQLDFASTTINHGVAALMPLAVGGTAVGTGLATHPQFGAQVAAEIARATGLPFVSAENKFAALASNDPVVFVHGTLKTLAAALTKIVNDIRWLASGPRCGLGELALPENEPGSSIMPGKVNPTQSEAVLMLCAQVMGNDVAVNIAGASGNFELNVTRPLVAHAVIGSVRLLADGMASFELHCARGIEARTGRIAELLDRSLMLVTSLAPHIGYDKAATVARRAHADGITLRQAAIATGYVSEEEFDRWVDPAAMVGPSR
jgi:fumarate hydratase, class II